jgi:hypothetical protein
VIAIGPVGQPHPGVKRLECEYVEALLRWAASGHRNSTIEEALVEDWGPVELERQRAHREVKP